MSEFEMDVLDKEMLEMANSRSAEAPNPVEDATVESATAMPEGEGGQRCTFWDDVKESIEKERQEREQWQRRRRIKTVAWLSICVMAVALLIAALYIPEMFRWVVNIGVLSFTVAAAIIVDRYIRRWML